MREWSGGRVMKNPRGYIKPEEVKKLYAACLKQRNKILIALLACTGKRITEVLKLKVYDIDFKENKIYFNIQKRKQKDYGRWKLQDPALIELIRDYIEGAGLKENEYLFRSKTSEAGFLSRQRANDIIKSVGKRAGLYEIRGELIHAHMFRHGVVMHLLKQGNDIIAVQDFIDHANITTTRVYSDITGLEKQSGKTRKDAAEMLKM